MAEPLAVDPTGLSAAAAKLAGLVFPQPPAPIAVSGTDSVVAAINETMPSIESLVSDGLPGVKAALTRTASNMNAAADVYAKTDQSLGTHAVSGALNDRIAALIRCVVATTATMGLGHSFVHRAGHGR